MTTNTSTLILLRHGESEWNAKNLFTGWVDVDLTDTGRQEATRGGELLANSDLLPDVVHTSLLTRAIRTSQLALEAADRQWIPVRRTWRLNERHYGALQGKDKKETLAEYGEEQFMLWRRSYDVPPPPIEPDDPFAQTDDPRYAALPPKARPATECLADVVRRLIPYWEDVLVADDLRAGRTVLVAAHGPGDVAAAQTDEMAVGRMDVEGGAVQHGPRAAREVARPMRVARRLRRLREGVVRAERHFATSAKSAPQNKTSAAKVC